MCSCALHPPSLSPIHFLRNGRTILMAFVWKAIEKSHFKKFKTNTQLLLWFALWNWVWWERIQFIAFHFQCAISYHGTWLHTYAMHACMHLSMYMGCDLIWRCKLEFAIHEHTAKRMIREIEHTNWTELDCGWISAPWIWWKLRVEMRSYAIE